MHAEPDDGSITGFDVRHEVLSSQNISFRRHLLDTEMCHELLTKNVPGLFLESEN